MELEYRIISIKTTNTEKLSNVVSQVLWSVRGTNSDGVFVAHAEKTDLNISDLDDQSENFIEYPNLRESIVSSWIENLLDSDSTKKQEIMNSLDQKLTKKLSFSSVENNKVPWEYGKEHTKEPANRPTEEDPDSNPKVDVIVQDTPDPNLLP